MLGWVASIVVTTLASSNLSSESPGPRPAGGIALSADFVLKTIDAQGTETVTGALRFIPGGDVCVAVKSPNLQEMHLSPRELVIYYPERDLAFVASVVPPHAPPMLDALAAGVADPGSTLPNQSKLLERKRENGNLFTRWRVVDGAGQELGEMRAGESRSGAFSLDLLDKAGKPQRRFSFGDRVRVGARSVPRTIGAEYFAAGGARQRREQWTLANVTRFDERRLAPIGCAHLGPHTKIQALEW
jgi:hypothetical protein